METDWLTLLRALQDAETHGDEIHARVLRAQLIAQRLELREAQVIGRLVAADFMLLLRLASQLEREGLHADAIAVHAGAFAHARAQNDDYTSTFFLLRMALSATAALDLGQAQKILTAASAHTIEAAASLAIAGINTFDRDTLRASALYAVARFYAARGELAAATDALERCLTLLDTHRDQFLSRGEVALLAAEVAVDRGAFALVHEYRARFAADGDESLQVRWDLVDAYAHRLRGELSRAEQELERAFLRSRGREEKTAAAALRLRADVLAILNRLDDAERALDLIGDDETDRLRQLIDARRSIEDDAAATPRSSGFRRRPRPAGQEPQAQPDFGERRSERIREDWTRALQSVLLALHRGEAGVAAAELAILIRWSETIDSPLVHAEGESAWAKTALAMGDAGSALRHADRAAARFRDLGMPLHEREALHVAMAALEVTKDAAAIEAHFARSTELISEVESRLGPADRKMFRLNKWNALDLEMERWCGDVGDAERAPHRQVRRLLARIDARRQNAEGVRETVRWPLALPWTLSLPRRSAVVYFVALPHRLQVFLLHASRCRMFSIAVARAGLWEIVITTMRALRDAGTPGPPPACETAGTRLGLGRLLAELPAGVDELHIVPDDVLINMPFAALTIGGRTLPERGYVLTVVPAPRWVDHAQQPLGRVSRGVAFGVMHTSVPDLEALPSAELEAQAVAQVLGRGSEAVLSDAATAAKVMAALPLADAAHFACHGEFDERHPERSGLAVADRWLTIADLNALDLSRLRLAVLGSCWSANTKVLPGREMVGLPIRLLDRGCRAVVASLWRLGDEAALDFARQYYVAVAHSTPARAMAAIQQTATRARVPADWAWFAIYASGISPAWPARMWLRAAKLIRRAFAPRSADASRMRRDSHSATR